MYLARILMTEVIVQTWKQKVLMTFFVTHQQLKCLGYLKEESLPEEDDVPSPDESSEEQKEVPEEADEDSENDLSEEEESTDSKEEKTDEDDKSTQDAELPSEDDIDWEYKVPVTIDGKTEYVTLEEIRKGYSTDQHLSQKGRELGELKKQIDQERTEKLQELVQLGSVVHEELTAVENKYAQEYNSLSAQIDKAKEEGDTYTVRELKEKREEVQEAYWNARTSREEKTKAVVAKLEEQNNLQREQLLQEYNSKITTLIPDYSEKVAKSIREFALSEGVPESLLDQLYSPEAVKFINDYRKLKTAQLKGEVKRKATPTVKSVPSKKGTPTTVKQKNAELESRNKVLSGQGSKQDELDFLKRISSVSKKL